MNHELILKKAAESASLNVKSIQVSQDDIFLGLIIGEKFTKQKELWNPFCDLKQAISLAEKLKIKISIGHSVVESTRGFGLFSSKINGDMASAICQSITLCAANYVGGGL